MKIISIPRLKLGGSHLFSELVHTVMQELNQIQIDSIHLWSDSTITLQWMLSVAHRWNTIVSNRVSQIQTLMPNATWRHVPTGDNPADVVCLISSFSHGIFGGAFQYGLLIHQLGLSLIWLVPHPQI